MYKDRWRITSSVAGFRNSFFYFIFETGENFPYHKAVWRKKKKICQKWGGLIQVDGHGVPAYPFLSFPGWDFSPHTVCRQELDGE